MREEQIIHSALITLTTLTSKNNNAFDFNFFNSSNYFNYQTNNAFGFNYFNSSNYFNS